MSESAKIPEALGKCEIVKKHDDGDLTIECGDTKYVVTTEGDVFRRVDLPKQPWQMTRSEFESDPNVVFHGARQEYRIATDRAGSATTNPTSRFGAFFSPSKKEAERYVSDFHGGKGEVLPAHVKLDNPYSMAAVEYDKIIGTDWKKLGVESGIKEISDKVDGIKARLINEGYDGIIIGEPNKPFRPQEIIAFNQDSIVQHRYAVEQALSEDKPVPDEVLKGYPDLKK